MVNLRHSDVVMPVIISDKFKIDVKTEYISGVLSHWGLAIGILCLHRCKQLEIPVVEESVNFAGKLKPHWFFKAFFENNFNYVTCMVASVPR